MKSNFEKLAEQTAVKTTNNDFALALRYAFNQTSIAIASANLVIETAMHEAKMLQHTRETNARNIKIASLLGAI